MIGKSISHYRIVEKLGEGGMGEVYLAEDTKLNRRVALKFLPVQLASDDEFKERFKREAQSAAALNHPNIITIHEVADYETRPFIAMEYVEGESLKDVIARKELSIGGLLDVASQISDGLSVAHQAGVIHRDIKPQNILMGKDGRVRICDFGLAKAKRDVTLTQVGSTLGTIAYMSPEQAQGRDVDQRSDIFSFGTVLYEMVAGQMPFRGEHEAAMIHAIVNDTPEPMARYKTDVPAGLQRIVDKCLKKDVATRYQSAAEVVSDLKELQQESRTTAPIRVPRRKTLNPVMLAGVGVLVLIAAYALISLLSPSGERQAVGESKMLAVLPFENLGSAEDEYFADGITEEILTNLSKLSGLGVISRSSSMQYKDSQKGIREIGKELGVDYILEGTIRWDKSGQESRVRINPQLIRVSDDVHLWADRYDATLTDIFEVQSGIAHKVAQALQVALLESEKQSLSKQPTQKPEAYNYFLRGNGYINQGFSERNFLTGIEMYEKAIELDSGFALAYAMASRAHLWLYWWEGRHVSHLEPGRRLAERALQLDPDLPEAHWAMAHFHYYGERDYQKALDELEHAKMLSPNSADIYEVIGYVKRRQGKWNEALQNFKKAALLNPLSIDMPWELGITLLSMRRYDEAETYYNLGFSLAPDNLIYTQVRYQLYLLWRGDVRRAKQVLEEGVARVDASEFVYGMVHCFRLERDYAAALQQIPTMTVNSNNDSTEYYLTKGSIHGLMNKTALAHAYYDSARIRLEDAIQREDRLPEHSYAWWYPAFNRAHLGKALAGLGKNEEAIRQGRLALELVPISRDALFGTTFLLELAKIYAAVGEDDLAIDLLEHLLSIPADISVPLLQLDPIWDPLRDNPRFEKLLEGGT